MATEFSVSELETDDLINELEARGFMVVDENEFDDYEERQDIMHATEKLYLDYMLTGSDFFNKELRRFFNKYVKGVNLV